ncbi:MAG: hypothetical protein P4L33_03620 [Capsulimonadaceae bacterium]|nr:hypothetical protein [Capsulimonadaceae bacterium]
MSNLNQPSGDPEIVITRGNWRLVVAPFGASMRGFAARTGDGAYVDVSTGYHGRDAKQGGEGDVLVPFPGRIAHGRYTFDGQSHQLDQNDKEGPAAIHGFVRNAVWNWSKKGDAIVFTTSFDEKEYPGYPFALNASMTYALTDAGLAVTTTVTNAGTGPAPVGVGFHPYYTVGSDLINADTLHVPFTKMIEFGEYFLPTGRILDVAGTPLDFTSPRVIGDVIVNACYLAPRRDADGMARVRLSQPATGRSVTIWQDRAYDYVVLYSGNALPENLRRRSLAIEPMSCATDAFNHEGWGTVRLEPGESFTGSWGVEAEGVV